MISLSKLPHHNGHNVYYETIGGDTAKPYLVFLHEGLGCTKMWRDFPKELCTATGCPGLLYDRIGYGHSSPWPHDYTRTLNYLHEYALQELPWVLGQVIPKTPFVLIGHSDGGSVSLIYGAQKPLLLRGIITEAAHVSVEEVTLIGIKKAQTAWTDGKLKGLEKHHGDKTETVFSAWSKTWLSQWFRKWNIEDLLPEIEAPLLIIQGGNDQYASIAQATRIASLSSGAAQLEFVKGCGHVPHFEAQSVVLSLMSHFIGQTCQK
ncbi:MAG: pimeloyl-ACP methyl ester carboxylesterase [Desulforhopalus sp.]